MAGFTPNKIFKGTNPDGTKFRIEEWDFADVAFMDAVSFVTILIFGCVFSAFIPLILTAMAIYHYNGRAKVFYILTMLISAYFIYDATHGWIVTLSLTFFTGEGGVNTLVSLTTACLVINGVFLLFGGVLYDIVEKSYEKITHRWVMFLFISLGIMLFTYKVSMAHYEGKRGWVERALNEGQGEFDPHVKVDQ